MGTARKEMVFSTTSRNVRVEHDRETDKIFLHAECKSDSGNWQSSSICLDDHLGISTEYKGFDTTQEQTASAQGQSLWSLLVPDRLTLKGVSVLCGKVREEHGGWETSIYLDLLFNNNNGQLVKESWYV
ncbi:CVNH domain-containing protein [Aspergillus udagawae]|uniref:Cyanovirin-N domain-containing protein n=1 Tax=Aspergillus udagawae TaxID=91492 RepID=A0A8E0V4V4_9EURO|nr:uncharacterized protein Aud_008820 [Aspergillus udagawae]GIC92354.1 hypothetical protein Aud_008820 [Aspergillus udagawae]